MKKFNEVYTLVDEAGIEVLVAGTVSYERPSIEYCHGPKEVGGGWSVDLTSVEVVIKGKGIDILKSMDYRQIQALEDEFLLEFEKNS